MKDKKQKDQLYREDYFSCPIYWMDKPEWVKKLNKASDPYIKKAAKNNKKQIDERTKKYGDKGDHGMVHHSTSLINDPKFADLQEWIIATANNLLIEQLMNLLPEKDKTKLTPATSQINYGVKPGRLIFFNSFMPHLYSVDNGYEPFRFIHWNLQAIPKGVVNYNDNKK
jgi:hypothetical protein